MNDRTKLEEKVDLKVSGKGDTVLISTDMLETGNFT